MFVLVDFLFLCVVFFSFFLNGKLRQVLRRLNLYKNNVLQLYHELQTLHKGASSL